MYPNLKSTFGAPANNTSFGFSSNVTPNPFGQSAFGKTTTTGFGAPSTAFGSTSAPLFGAATQHGPLFATATPASFGQAATTQPAFGSGMFGSTTAQPSGSGLFGAANTSTFGQQNKAPGFGFGSNTASTGFFGQNAVQPPQQQSTGLFGQTTTNLFGSSSGFGSNTTTNQLGTVIKFTPVTGTDIMVKGSINQTISTRHHCITCMKEYENKSLEELRWEDYQVNRKGPQQASQPAGGLFGNISQPVGGGLFGSGPVATSANTLFGQQQENKSVFGNTGTTGGFGQTNTAFGTTPATNASSGLFGKPLTGFGTSATTTSTFPFSSSAQQSTNLFGTNTVSKGFGVATPQNNLFAQPSGFGNQTSFGTFGANTNQNVGLFNQNKTTPFNMATSTNNSFGSFGQPAAQNTGSLFSGAKTNTGFGGFGVTTTAPVFGQSSFGQTNPGLFNTSFNKTPTPLFGQTNTTNTLGTGLSMGGGASLFGSNVNKPNTMFGNNLGMFNSGFGNTAANPSFNLGGTATQPGVTTTDQSNINGEQQIISMSSTPYGLPNLLNNINELDNDIKDCTRPTNPGELNALLNTVNKSQTNTLTEKLQPVQVFGRKIPMFDGLEHRDETLISNIRINNNPKRLVVRHNQLNSSESPKQDYIRTNSSKLILENDSNKGDSSYLEESMKENLYPDLRKELSSPISMRRSLTGTTKWKNASYPDISNVHLPLSSTMITSPSKVLFIPPETNSEDDGEGKDEDGELFAEASDSQDWQDDQNDSVLGLANDASKFSGGANTSGTTQISQHPTGIVLTRPEYYTVPSLDDLVKYISEDGSCVVKGFTVGRVGYGNVYFPDAFDVSNLNLDELVHFRHKEINIYPDDTKKPQQGHGLNRKAQVTLDKVWPLDKKSKSLNTNVDSLTKMDYAGRLRRLCEKQNTRFVEYRPDTGSWVFKVDHFSKYGHRDSDESDDETVAKDPEQQKILGLKKPLIGKNDVKIPYATEIIENGAASNSELLGLKDIVDTTYRHNMDDEDIYLCMDDYDLFRNGNIKIADDVAKCTLMKSTFFEADVIDYDDSASDVCSSDGGILELSNYVSRSSPKRKDDFDDNMIECEPTLMLDIFQDEIPVACPAELEYVQLSFSEDSLTTAEANLSNFSVSDVTAFKGRSYKVGWCKNMTLLCLGSRNTIDVEESNSDTSNDFLTTTMRSVHIKKLKNTHDLVFQDSLEKHLNCQLLSSNVEMIDNIPYFSSVTGFQLLQNQQKIYRKKSIDNYDKQIWDLCNTLWDEIPEEDLQRFDNRTIRKRLFSYWIKSVVETSVISEMDDTKRNALSNILTCISGNRISEAADIALQTNNYNLSLLISQMPSSMSSRSYLKKQLEQWTQCDSNKHIDPDLLKLYMLIAGSPFANYEDRSVCVYEGMDWIRILAIYFWYINEPGETLSHAVNMYENIFTNHIHTIKPTPDYEDASEDVYDLRFQLLKFFSDNSYPLTQVLNPCSHTNDSLDYRLSWFLLQTLISLGHADISKQAKVFMHTSFASQLEQMDLWHWAIFVLLFLEENEIKKTLILDILGRHVQLFDTSTEEYRTKENMLVNDFQIPHEWLDASKSMKAVLQENYKEAVYYLCYAKMWQEAYDLIMKYMIPDHFLCYDYEYLIKILTPLSHHKNLLPNWEEAGGLVLDFAKLGIQYNNIISLNDPIDIKKNLISFRSAVINVSVRFKHFTPLTYLHDVCLAEMSGRIAVMLRKLLNIINGHTYELCVDTAINAQTLPMTADYLKQELNSILIDFLSGTQPKMIYL